MITLIAVLFEILIGILIFPIWLILELISPSPPPNRRKRRRRRRTR